MAVAPDLFDIKHAKSALKQGLKYLCNDLEIGQVGIKTLNIDSNSQTDELIHVHNGGE